MTQEEAIKIFRKEIECLSHTKCEDCILEKACDPMNTTPYDSEYIEAYSMAIKALEQEPMLDKIRAEIAEYGSIMVSYAITKDTKTDKGIEKLVSGVLKQAKEQVLEIIDKYKAESEE